MHGSFPYCPLVCMRPKARGEKWVLAGHVTNRAGIARMSVSLYKALRSQQKVSSCSQSHLACQVAMQVYSLRSSISSHLGIGSTAGTLASVVCAALQQDVRGGRAWPPKTALDASYQSKRCTRLDKTSFRVRGE